MTVADWLRELLDLLTTTKTTTTVQMNVPSVWRDEGTAQHPGGPAINRSLV